MRSIARVFGRSPFLPLQNHMEKVARCIGLIPEAFDAFYAGDAEGLGALAERISKLEAEADEVKLEIRNSMPRGLFMPVDRSSLLAILHAQDDIADYAENLAVLLTFRQPDVTPGFRAVFDPFLVKNLEAFDAVRLIVAELDELLEAGFGGAEAQKVRSLAHDVAVKEHEADLIQREALAHLFRHESETTHAGFYHWMRIIREVAGLSNQSENLAELVRMTLESK